MSGTLLISKGCSFDVRTIDFIYVVNELRSQVAQSETAVKLIKTVDEFGINMICADELNEKEFKDFGQMIRRIRFALSDDEAGLITFLDLVYRCIEADERFSD